MKFGIGSRYIVTRAAEPAPVGAGLHLVVVVLALLTCVFAPRPGKALLLVSVGAAHAQTDAGNPALSGQGWALAGRGRIAGSWLVRPSGPVPVWTLLRHGIVPLAVPDVLCGNG